MAQDSKENRAPILVTGAHRSGTTWVGKMLALASELVYVHEPFNPRQSSDLSTLQMQRWYEYIPSEATAADYDNACEQLLDLRYPTYQRLGSFSTHFAIQRTLYFRIKRWWGARALVKDPLALFSAEWLTRQFDIDVLVMIRHPAGFAGSLKKKDWRFPFNDLLSQPRLMDDLLAPYRDEITRFAATERHIVDQAALVWTLLYSVVERYQAQQPEWTFLRHEDLARTPVTMFSDLYGRYNLNFTDSIRREIKEYSGPAGAKVSDQSMRRDSASVVRNWTRRLTGEEIHRVRAQTAEVASTFYNEDDWDV